MSIQDSPSKKSLATVFNHNQLSKSLECLNITESTEDDLYDIKAGEKYQIHICAYAINTGCFLEGASTPKTNKLRAHQYVSYNKYYPFLQFIVKHDKNNRVVDFPAIDYICPPAAENITVKDDCIQHILDTLIQLDANLHDGQRDITKCFKGFIRREPTKGVLPEHQKPTVVYVLFDLTVFQEDIRSDTFIWGTVDELVYKKTVFADPTGKSVADFFKEYECMSLLRTTDELAAELPFPFQVYMCKRGADGKYVNVLADDPHSDYLVEHPTYGMGYLFTAEPEFLMENTTDKLRRYVLYPSNCNYVLNPEKDSEKSMFKSTVYFVEEDIQMWFVKNVLHFMRL